MIRPRQSEPESPNTDGAVTLVVFDDDNRRVALSDARPGRDAGSGYNGGGMQIVSDRMASAEFRRIVSAGRFLEMTTKRFER